MTKLLAWETYTLAEDLTPDATSLAVNEPPRMKHDVVFTYSGNGNALRRMARHLNHRGQRRYRLKFADTCYGELNHYGMHWLRWADVRRRRY